MAKSAVSNFESGAFNHSATLPLGLIGLNKARFPDFPLLAIQAGSMNCHLELKRTFNPKSLWANSRLKQVDLNVRQISLSQYED